MLLADRERKNWNFANRVYEILAHHKESRRKYLLGEVNVGYFPDGELHAEIDCNVRALECYFMHDCSMYPQDGKETILQTNDALQNGDAGVINNVIPYLGYSRSDRPTGRTSLSAALFADNIKRSGAKRVITTDLHNPAIRGFYKGISFENLKGAYKVLIDHLKEKYADFLEDAVVISPDEGSAKRTGGFGKRLGLRPVSIHKVRDEKTQQIVEMSIIGDVSGRNVLMVDDMVTTAGTACGAAYTLKDAGANSILMAATHGVLCEGDDGMGARGRIRESPIERMIITDSIPQESDGETEVVSIDDFIAEVIKRITHAESISELYRA